MKVLNEVTRGCYYCRVSKVSIFCTVFLVCGMHLLCCTLICFFGSIRFSSIGLSCDTTDGKEGEDESLNKSVEDAQLAARWSTCYETKLSELGDASGISAGVFGASVISTSFNLSGIPFSLADWQSNGLAFTCFCAFGYFRC
jgi:hypothetical protein